MGAILSSCLSCFPALCNKLQEILSCLFRFPASGNKLQDILSCLSWFAALRNKLQEILRGPYKHLPDEILLQILSKLPAKSVVRGRAVCRRWKTLTSSREFARLHLNHSVPMIIIEREHEGTNEVYLVDAENTSTSTESYHYKVEVNSVKPVSKANRQEFLYSSSGLLIFLEEFRESTSGLEHYILLNPITREKLRLITPKGLIYGIYSNPIVKDQYCVLWGGRFLRQNGSMQFRIVVLGGGSWSKSENFQPQNCCCWRELDDDDDALVSYQPRAQIPPIIVHDVLYWMVGNRYAIARQSSSSPPSPPPGTRLAPSCAESIMAFDRKSEKFYVMPHPGPRDQYCKDDPEHNRMHLVDTDFHGFLCLCECSLFEESINVWILIREDHGNRPSWMRLHRINTDSEVIRFPFTLRPNHNVRPVLILGPELLLEWPNRGIVAINLWVGTVRMLDRRAVRMYAHTPSFIPLSNCEPESLMSA